VEGGSYIVIKLHEWQVECLDIWAKNSYRGIVNAVTGSGKTVLALVAATRLEAVSDKELRVKIVVPQTFLAAQWKDEIKRQLGATSADIGYYTGKRKDQSRKYMIYVVNSARFSLARHILADLSDGCSVLLIADECHHYGSAENNCIFDFYKMMGKDAPYYALGLSATPEIVNFKAISTPLGREIYCYDLKKAVKDNIISRFILFCVSLDFSAKEQAEYADLSVNLSKNLLMLRKMRPELNGLTSDVFFAHLQRLANLDCDATETARTALALMYNRRTLCHMAAERPRCAISVVKALPAKSRIILFCERIHAAELLCNELSKEFPNQVGLYHSKMSENARQDTLDRYKHGYLRLLICCKALDEGLNIPSTDAGIIVSSSMSARQRIQRLGRILRRSKEIKRIYYLYIRESSEDSELVFGLRSDELNIPIIALHCNRGVFYHPFYEKLRTSVLEFVKSRRYDPPLLDAISVNIDRALVRGDFMLTEKACREHLNDSISTAERNYWASVLYVILARNDISQA